MCVLSCATIDSVRLMMLRCRSPGISFFRSIHPKCKIDGAITDTRRRVCVHGKHECTRGCWSERVHPRRVCGVESGSCHASERGGRTLPLGRTGAEIFLSEKKTDAELGGKSIDDSMHTMDS